MKFISDEKPNIWQLRRNGGQRQLMLFLNTTDFVSPDFEEQEVPSQDMPKRYISDQIILPLSRFDYASIVSALINNQYSQDQMDAIVNNYLVDKKNHKTEFDEMQKFRTFAKETAKQIVVEVEEYIKKEDEELYQQALAYNTEGEPV